jgi:2-methylcitrate dehydratase PrpD
MSATLGSGAGAERAERDGMSEPVTRILADALAAARFGDLPPSVVAHAGRAVLDWLGSALAGSIEAPARMAQRVVAGFGSSGESTIFGAARASAAAAALANGVSTHILELDDVHKGSTLHGAAPIIPAALAVAEREHRSGPDFLLAVTLGYEAALRVGEAVNPEHYRFWHPTGTAATFGAAAAAASLMRLDARRMRDALGSAGTQAAGLWEFNADGAMSKHLHPGKAAFNGVLAADLARAGFTGASRILEGERGFFRATSTGVDATRVTDGLGTRWKISENCFKLHSCCGHTHSAIDVALELRSDGALAPIATTGDTVGMAETIDSIWIETYAPGYEIVKEMNPRTPYQAKFSLAYCVAAALLEGQVGLDQFSPERFGANGVREPHIAALLARTHVTVSRDLTARYPEAWPVRLILRRTDGSELRRESEYPRGNPENPVSTAELEAKLVALVSPRFGSGVARHAIDAANGVPDCEDMSTLFRGLLPSE